MKPYRQRIKEIIGLKIVDRIPGVTTRPYYLADEDQVKALEDLILQAQQDALQQGSPTPLVDPGHSVHVVVR